METISAKELERYARDGRYLIIDLRSVEEYRREHVRGAVRAFRKAGRERDPVL